MFILECMAYYYKMRFGLLQKWDSCPKKIIATKWRLDILWWVLDMKKNCYKMFIAKSWCLPKSDFIICYKMIIGFVLGSIFFATTWRLVSFWGQDFLLQNEDWFFIILKSLKKTCYKWQSGCLLQNGFPKSFFAFCRMSEWLFCSVHKFSHSVVEILLWGVLTWAPWIF